MGELLKAFGGYGLPGLVIAALLVWIYRLHKQTTEEHAAHVKDLKEFTATSIELQDKVHDTVSRLSQILDAIESRRTP